MQNSEFLAIPAVMPKSRVSDRLSPIADANRIDLLTLLRSSPDMARIVESWSKGDTFVPTGPKSIIMNLSRNSDGTLNGFAREANGRFIGQAKWERVGGIGKRLATTAIALVGHVMLVEISVKLDRVESKVNRIDQALRDDRREGLLGAVNAVEHALQCEREVAEKLLAGAATPLTQHIRMEAKSLQRDIQAIEEPPEWHITKFFNDPSDAIKDDLFKCEDSLISVLEGIRSLGQLYVGLGQSGTAWKVIHDMLRGISRKDLIRAELIGRKLAPTDEHPWPDRFWMEAGKAVDDAIKLSAENAVLAEKADSLPLCIELTEKDFSFFLSESPANLGLRDGCV